MVGSSLIYLKIMKNKWYLIVIFLILALAFLLWSKFSINSSNEKKSKIEVSAKIDSSKVSIDTLQIFTKFANDFNSHKSEKINSYVNSKLGMVMYYHDGPYPIIESLSDIKQNLDWISEDIFIETKLSDFPEYLGDFQFSKIGFFVQKNNGNFSLRNYNNDYTNHPESFFQENKKLEGMCNFIAMGISKKQSSSIVFYFNLNGQKLTLLSLEVEEIEDSFFANPNKKNIILDSKDDILKYIEEKKIFKDKEHNAYIDFSKKEITYFDFPEPIVFDRFEIGEIENISKKIKNSEVIFYFDANNEDEKLITEFSSKGDFVVYPMGVRPPYIYSSQ